MNQKEADMWTLTYTLIDGLFDEESRFWTPQECRIDGFRRHIDAAAHAKRLKDEHRGLMRDVVITKGEILDGR
jgi:hypothetical protein